MLLALAHHRMQQVGLAAARRPPQVHRRSGQGEAAQMLEHRQGQLGRAGAPPHLVRTRLLFSGIYRGSGIRVAFRVARQMPTLRSIVWEVAALPFLPAQVLVARAELARRRG